MFTTQSGYRVKPARHLSSTERASPAQVLVNISPTWPQNADAIRLFVVLDKSGKLPDDEAFAGFRGEITRYLIN